MAKRSRSDDAGNTASEESLRSPKRQRTDDNTQGPLARMPAEIRQGIVQYLIDPIELRNSVKDIENLRQTNLTFNQDVKELIRKSNAFESQQADEEDKNPEIEFQSTNKILKSIGKILENRVSRIGKFEIKNRATTREEHIYQSNLIKCDLIPLENKSEKSQLVRDILRSPDVPLKYDAIHSLGLNIAFLEPRDRVAIVDAVCARHSNLVKDEIGSGLGDTIKALVERVEYLAPSEQEKLLDAVLETTDIKTRGACLEMFAGKIHGVASADSQERIIEAVKGDPTDRAFRLALLAKNLDGISMPGRELTARAVLSLDRNEAGRLWALSKLVDKLGSLEPETCRDVSNLAEWEITNSGTETYDPQGGRWYTKPAISRVEIAYHLYANKNLLTEETNERVKSCVSDILYSGSSREKGQLLPLVRRNGRKNFLRTHLPEDAEEVLGDDEKTKSARNTIKGMTLRVDDLGSFEKGLVSNYLVALPKHETAGFSEYNISNNLSNFEWSDANEQVLSWIEEKELNGRHDIESAAESFSEIARQAGQLERSTVASAVRAAEKITEEFIDDCGDDEPTSKEYAALRSLTVFAAQSVANNCLAELTRGRVGLVDHLEPPKAREMTQARQSYDDRDRAAERAR